MSLLLKTERGKENYQRLSSLKGKITFNLIFGLAVLFLLLSLGGFGEAIAPYSVEKMHFDHIKEAPSGEFILGTDRYGRDVLSRVIVGTRITLVISLASTSLAVALGVIVGVVSAYYGKLIDNLLMRVVDVFISFPALIFAMLIIGVLGPGMLNGIIAIAIIFFPGIARVVRSAAISIVNLEYIDAAKLLGESSLHIIFREVLPNLYPTIIVESSIRLGYAILLSASLSFVGLGPPPPAPDWGLMASEERGYMLQNPWPVFAPSLAIVVSVIGVNLFGDGLRRLIMARNSSR